MTAANIIDSRLQICGDHWIDIEVLSRISGRIEHVGECHIVEGYRNANGHVKVENHGKPVWVHRAVFAFWHGPLLPGEVVCHRCDVGA